MRKSSDNKLITQVVSNHMVNWCIFIFFFKLTSSFQ